MIYLYSGTPGSGKSLHTARVIYYSLKRGCPVIANFSINLDKIKGKKSEFVEKDNSDLTPSFLIEYARNYFHGNPDFRSVHPPGQLPVSLIMPAL